jgi:hypothetical protein
LAFSGLELRIWLLSDQLVAYASFAREIERAASCMARIAKGVLWVKVGLVSGVGDVGSSLGVTICTACFCSAMDKVSLGVGTTLPIPTTAMPLVGPTAMPLSFAGVV